MKQPNINNMTESKVVRGSGPLYEQALTYNAKGDVLSGWGGHKIEGINYFPPAEGTCGILWAVNEAPIDQYKVPYAWNWIRSVWATEPLAYDSWVEWGDVAGDENYLSPAVYEIFAVVTDQSPPPRSPIYTATTSFDMFTDYIDLDTHRRVAIGCDISVLSGGPMYLQMDVTIRQKSDHSNSVTNEVKLTLLDAAN